MNENNKKTRSNRLVIIIASLATLLIASGLFTRAILAEDYWDSFRGIFTGKHHTHFDTTQYYLKAILIEKVFYSLVGVGELILAFMGFIMLIKLSGEMKYRKIDPPRSSIFLQVGFISGTVMCSTVTFLLIVFPRFTLPDWTRQPRPFYYEQHYFTFLIIQLFFMSAVTVVGFLYSRHLRKSQKVDFPGLSRLLVIYLLVLSVECTMKLFSLFESTHIEKLGLITRPSSYSSLSYNGLPFEVFPVISAVTHSFLCLGFFLVPYLLLTRLEKSKDIMLSAAGEVCGNELK